jgi:hypothetical protein
LLCKKNILDKPPRDRTAFPSVRFGLRAYRRRLSARRSSLPDGERNEGKRIRTEEKNVSGGHSMLKIKELDKSDYPILEEFIHWAIW